MPQVRSEARISVRVVPSSCTATSASSCSPSQNAIASAAKSVSERGQEKASAGQRVGESGEGSEIEGFSTNVGVQIEGEQRRCNAFARQFERERQRVGERLAAVRECAAHD